MSPDAEMFLKNLPKDEDDPVRALAFRALIEESRSCRESRVTAKELYRVAASDEWHLGSLHDINMVVVALELNRDLVNEVRGYVETLLRQFDQTRSGVQDTWRWIQDEGAFKMRA